MSHEGIIVKNADGSLSVPDYPIIPFIEGDGIGPDIWQAAQLIMDRAVEIGIIVYTVFPVYKLIGHNPFLGTHNLCVTSN